MWLFIICQHITFCFETSRLVEKNPGYNYSFAIWFLFYHKPLISILKCFIYLNRYLFRTIYLPCDYLSCDKALISVLKWIIYFNSTFLTVVHLSCDIAHKASSQNMHRHQRHLSIPVLPNSTTFMVVRNYSICF